MTPEQTFRGPMVHRHLPRQGFVLDVGLEVKPAAIGQSCSCLSICPAVSTCLCIPEADIALNSAWLGNVLIQLLCIQTP